MLDPQLSLKPSEINMLQQLGIHTDDHDTLVEAFARICWSRLTEPGDATANILIDTVGASQALGMVIDSNALISAIESVDGVNKFYAKELKSGLDRWQLRLDREAILNAMQTAVENKFKIITPDSEYWPHNLYDLKPHSPLMLWTKGDRSLLQKDSIAIVGARASTAYGEQVTGDFASTAVRFNHTVVSGAAYGIDAVAHRATLANSGKTIAVLAGGLDRLYPVGNARLITQISKEGLVCSEMIPGSAPTGWRFLQRNRLVASLSKATLVTEAGSRSGSINTGGHAAQLGRQIGAVPGPITSVSSIGTHRLLKEYDAMLITNESDLAELLGMDSSNSHGLDKRKTGKRQLSVHRRIDDAIPLRGTITTKNIAKRAGISLNETEPILAELQLLGSVEPVTGKNDMESKWRRIKNT